MLSLLLQYEILEKLVTFMVGRGFSKHYKGFRAWQTCFILVSDPQREIDWDSLLRRIEIEINKEEK